MGAGPIRMPDGNALLLFDGTVDLDSDEIRCALFTSDYTIAGRWYDDAHELATEHGYERGGKALTNREITEVLRVVRLYADETSWTITGEPITARYGVLYDDTADGKPVLGVFLLDGDDLDVTVNPGQDLRIVWNAAGILRAVRAEPVG